jgi:hypothetical protein
MSSVTPETIEARFRALSPSTVPSAFTTEAYADWVDAIEVGADAHPGDPRWTELLLDARLLARPVPQPAGWRCTRCIRADRVSSTWVARDTDADTWLLRVADAHPHARRILARDARALAASVDGLVVQDGLIAAPAPGSPLVDSLHGITARDQQVHVLARTLAALQGWEDPAWGPGRPVPEELRRTRGSPEIVLVALTPAAPGTRDALDAVVAALPPPDGRIDGPIDRFLAGLSSLVSPDAHDVEDLLKRALVESLGEQVVQLRQRRLQTRQDNRRERLQQMLERLVTALPPPEGEGPIGFDLDGRTTRVMSDGTTVRWGPTDTDGDVLYGTEGFDAPTARRFLRACATAPARPEGTGDPGTTEQINRWVSAGLRLRTMRMLLDRAGG